jgi:hypothetical protein
MTQKRRFGLLLAVMLLLLGGVGMATAGWLVYTGGPYRGQLLDAETRQPLEGAVVLFYWERDVYGGAGGPVAFFLTAKEVLTDKEGRFHLPWFIGMSLSPLSVVREPLSIFYYPGYSSKGLEVTPHGGEPFRDPTVILMRRLLSQKERLGGIDVFPGGGPDEAMPNLSRLVNIERAALGLQPVHVRSGGRP